MDSLLSILDIIVYTLLLIVVCKLRSAVVTAERHSQEQDLRISALETASWTNPE